MSRIGKKPVILPAGTEVSVRGNILTVKGPKGTLEFTHRREVSVAVEGGELVVLVPVLQLEVLRGKEKPLMPVEGSGCVHEPPPAVCTPFSGFMP